MKQYVYYSSINDKLTIFEHAPDSAEIAFAMLCILATYGNIVVVCLGEL